MNLQGTTEQTADIRAKIVEFQRHLKKNEAENATLKNCSSMLTKLPANTDLTPESVKEYLAKTNERSNSSKGLLVVIYSTVLKFAGMMGPSYSESESKNEKSDLVP